MDVTQETRSLILQAARNKGITQSDIAHELGHGKAWVSKLLNGAIKRLSDADVEKLEDFLDIQFFALHKTEKVSGLAIELSKATERNPHLAQALNEILLMLKSSPLLTHQPTKKQFVELGNEIVRIVDSLRSNPDRVAIQVAELVVAAMS